MTSLSSLKKNTIGETQAEFFPALVCPLLITTTSKEDTRIISSHLAARTFLALEQIECGINAFIKPSLTPDNRPGVFVTIWMPLPPSLYKNIDLSLSSLSSLTSKDVPSSLFSSIDKEKILKLKEKIMHFSERIYIRIMSSILQVPSVRVFDGSFLYKKDMPQETHLPLTSDDFSNNTVSFLSYERWVYVRETLGNLLSRFLEPSLLVYDHSKFSHIFSSELDFYREDFGRSLYSLPLTGGFLEVEKDIPFTIGVSGCTIMYSLKNPQYLPLLRDKIQRLSLLFYDLALIFSSASNATIIKKLKPSSKKKLIPNTSFIFKSTNETPPFLSSVSELPFPPFPISHVVSFTNRPQNDPNFPYPSKRFNYLYEVVCNSLTYPSLIRFLENLSHLFDECPFLESSFMVTFGSKIGKFVIRLHSEKKKES